MTIRTIICMNTILVNIHFVLLESSVVSDVEKKKELVTILIVVVHTITIFSLRDISEH